MLKLKFCCWPQRNGWVIYIKVIVKKGKKNIITKSHSKLDLTNQRDVINFFKKIKLSKFIWPQQKWVVFMRILNFQRNSFIKI